MPIVIVMGGSLGGLTAALVLRDAGCDVRVFERSSSALRARGAGIAVLDATLRYLTERGGYRAEDVCSATGWIRFVRADGSVQHEQRHCYRFSRGTRSTGRCSGCSTPTGTSSPASIPLPRRTSTEPVTRSATRAPPRCRSR
jgi:2-polyprenyl-6-methoxyphenol hydroxylase-like FAD-dependent oxidoreductase